MNTNNIMPFLKMKNNKGEDVYSIDKLGHALVISPLKNNINMFDTVTVYDPTMENVDGICNINFSEVFITALYDALEKHKLYGDSKVLSKFTEDNNMEPIIVQFLKSKFVFREIHECFSNGGGYVEPDSEKITKELNTVDDLLKSQKKLETYVRETPKIGANDPCPCGSGVKYKKCCRDKESNNVG